MAEPKPARLAFRLAVVTAVLAALLAGIAPSGGSAAPATVVRTVRVAAADLVPTRPGPTISLADGRLRAATDARTAPVAVCAPMWFTAVGITWSQPEDGEVHLNVASAHDRSSFGTPTRLDAEDDADPGTPDFRERRGSSMLWTGGARCVRLRIELAASVEITDVRAVFVNSSGTPNGPRTATEPNLGPVAIRQAAGGFAPVTAMAEARRPRIITREQWGADPDLMNCTPLVADEVRMGFVHHTAGSNAYSEAESDDVVRGVYAYHTNGRGWCDIGYNFLVDRYGNVFEGRSGGVDRPVIGAAQMGFNTRAFSVSAMGDFETAAVPRKTQRALVRILAWRLDVAHVNPALRAKMTSAGGDNARYIEGTVVRLKAISGHRDTGYTACPGGRLYQLLPEIRARVASRGLPKLYKPRLSNDRFVSGEPVNVRIRAKGSTALTWEVSVLAPDGSTFRTFDPPRSTQLDLLWPRSEPASFPTEPGIYQIAITAGAKDGVARPALLPLTILPIPPPSPSPSPSASPSPSTSPSP